MGDGDISSMSVLIFTRFEPVVTEAGSSSFSSVSTASCFFPADANAKRLLSCSCLCSSSRTRTSSLLSDVEMN